MAKRRARGPTRVRGAGARTGWNAVEDLETQDERISGFLREWFSATNRPETAELWERWDHEIDARMSTAQNLEAALAHYFSSEAQAREDIRRSNLRNPAREATALEQRNAFAAAAQRAFETLSEREALEEEPFARERRAEIVDAAESGWRSCLGLPALPVEDRQEKIGKDPAQFLEDLAGEIYDEFTGSDVLNDPANAAPMSQRELAAVLPVLDGCWLPYLLGESRAVAAARYEPPAPPPAGVKADWEALAAALVELVQRRGAPTVFRIGKDAYKVTAQGWHGPRGDYLTPGSVAGHLQASPKAQGELRAVVNAIAAELLQARAPPPAPAAPAAGPEPALPAEEPPALDLPHPREKGAAATLRGLAKDLQEGARHAGKKPYAGLKNYSKMSPEELHHQVENIAKSYIALRKWGQLPASFNPYLLRGPRTVTMAGVEVRREAPLAGAPALAPAPAPAPPPPVAGRVVGEKSAGAWHARFTQAPAAPGAPEQWAFALWDTRGHRVEREGEGEEARAAFAEALENLHEESDFIYSARDTPEGAAWADVVLPEVTLGVKNIPSSTWQIRLRQEAAWPIAWTLHFANKFDIAQQGDLVARTEDEFRALEDKFNAIGSLADVAREVHAAPWGAAWVVLPPAPPARVGAVPPPAPPQPPPTKPAPRAWPPPAAPGQTRQRRPRRGATPAEVLAGQAPTPRFLQEIMEAPTVSADLILSPRAVAQLHMLANQLNIPGRSYMEDLDLVRAIRCQQGRIRAGQGALSWNEALALCELPLKRGSGGRQPVPETHILPEPGAPGPKPARRRRVSAAARVPACAAYCTKGCAGYPTCKARPGGRA